MNDKFQKMVDEELGGISRSSLSMYFTLSNTKKGRDTVSGKYTGKKPVIARDIAVLSLLKILKNEGFDVDNPQIVDGEIALNKTQQLECF